MTYFQRLVVNTLTFISLSVVFPGMIHVRGIMRNYCRLCSLNPKYVGETSLNNLVAPIYFINVWSI